MNMLNIVSKYNQVVQQNTLFINPLNYFYFYVNYSSPPQEWRLHLIIKWWSCFEAVHKAMYLKN